MSRHTQVDEKNIEKDLTQLTDFDIFELFIDSVKVFVDASSRLDIEQHKCFEYGKILWKEAIEARDEYRKSNPFHMKKSFNGM